MLQEIDYLCRACSVMQHKVEKW